MDGKTGYELDSDSTMLEKVFLFFDEDNLEKWQGNNMINAYAVQSWESKEDSENTADQGKYQLKLRRLSDDSDTDVLDDYDDGEYIFPTSDTRKLTKSDIKGKSKKELRIGRNEIYARHGRRFQDEELQDYFDSQLWYEGTTDPQDFSEDELSSVEKRNARYIQKFE